MTTLQSMANNLTLPYRQGAYVKEIELGYRTDRGITRILGCEREHYAIRDYAERYGIALWDIEPVYLVAPRFDLGDEYIYLSFTVQGWPEDRPLPQVRIPAGTPAGTTFIIPLEKDVTGLTQLTEWPEPEDARPGRERWQVLVLVGNLGRLLWTLSWERARLGAVARDVGGQRQLTTAHGHSLDLIGQELRVPRLLASPYPVDPATIALYHLNRMPDDDYDLTTVGDRVIDETGRHHGTNEGATRGALGRIDLAFAFRSGDLPRHRCAAEYEFQERLRSGDWNALAGEREVRYGPYRRYAYREGAIKVMGSFLSGVSLEATSHTLADSELISALNADQVPELLRQTLQDHGISLSESARVVPIEEGKRWRISDGEDEVFIVREHQALNMYEGTGVWVNDEAEDPALRGQLTSACYGFVPRDLEETIKRFEAQGRSTQAAIDYFGSWWGRPEDWSGQVYKRYDIEAPHERCSFLVETSLTYVRIPNHDAFDVPADQGFTVEAFIRPVPVQDDRLRVIAIKSNEIFYGGPLPVRCVEGWALSMGTFNCIPNNLAWSISDLLDIDHPEHGERIVTVTADLDLGDERWHHVAGVIDRRYQVARLYVDGVERGCRDIRHIGEIRNQEDILLGINDYYWDAPYDGLIDEVRLSNVARHSFHPALGESDERYRTRLSIYRPWLIPTYGNIRAGLRRLLKVSPFGPEVVPPPKLPEIEVIEQDGVRLCTERLLKIRPLSLPPGAHIDLEGDRQKNEEEACGPRDEHFFEWQLVTHDNSAVDYAAPNAQRMQLAVARSLDNLVELLEPWMDKPEKELQVLGAYEPGGDDRRAVGRALHLHMEGLPASVLSAFAHKACFDYVEHQAGEVVRAAVREELDKLEIVTKDEADKQQWPTRNDPIQVKVGDDPIPVQLTVARPVVPDERYFNWLLIECDPGRGELWPACFKITEQSLRALKSEGLPDDVLEKLGGLKNQALAGEESFLEVLQTTIGEEQTREYKSLILKHARDNACRLFVPKTPGRLIVKVEYNWQGTIFAGRREIQIGLESLPACESIGSDGALGVSEEEAAGKPEGYFHEALLVEHDDSERVAYGDDPNHHRMQLSVEKALDELLRLIEGKLQILKGYDPTADDLRRVGRKLMLAHEDQQDQQAMPLGALAALAHDAGFAWVEHPPYSEGIWVATGPEPPLEIDAAPIEHLAPNAVVNWLGIMRPDVPEAPVMPGITFDATEEDGEGNLVNWHDDPGRVTYADDRSHLMTPATQEKLNALLDRPDQEVDGKLHILGAFEDTAQNRRRVGTALLMRHETIPLERLGALAHQIGFDYVKHVTVPSDPDEHHIYASLWRGEDFGGLTAADIAEIVDYGLLDLEDHGEVAEGGVRQLCLRPDVLAWTPPPISIDPEAEEEAAPPPAYQAPLPEAAHYYWCLTRYGPGQGRLDSPPERHCKLVTAQRAGVVGARGEFVLGDGTEPYRFALEMVADEEGRVPPLPKPVYDDLMNFLEFRHPVGVEGHTLTLRQHVPELMADRLLRNANTERTYPRYRQRRGMTGRSETCGEKTSQAKCTCPTWEGDIQEEVDEDG